MKFREATLYAKGAMKDPVKKEFYWKRAKKLKLPNAYTAAITDYMRKAEIKKIDTKAYHGNAGDKITIDAVKKGFPIAEMSVTLLDKNGQRIESGNAVQNNTGQWVYRTTMSGIDVGDVKVAVNIRSL
jgi:hypothetical protein